MAAVQIFRVWAAPGGRALLPLSAMAINPTSGETDIFVEFWAAPGSRETPADLNAFKFLGSGRPRSLLRRHAPVYAGRSLNVWNASRDEGTMCWSAFALENTRYGKVFDNGSNFQETRVSPLSARSRPKAVAAFKRIPGAQERERGALGAQFGAGCHRYGLQNR